MKLHYSLPLLLASALLAQADIIPAQPITNLKTASKKDPNENADPFNIVQLDDRILFIARNNTGYALYTRNLDNPKVAESGPDPVFDLTVAKHTPTKLKQFSATTHWDGYDTSTLPNLAIWDNPNLSYFKSSHPTEGTLFFHVQGMGLYMSQATTLTTKKLLDVDLAKTNDNFEWLSFLTAHQSGPESDTEAVFFAGQDKKKGVELFKAGPAAKPKAKLFADLNPGAEPSYPYSIVSSFRDLYLGAYNVSTQSYEVFHSDGVNPPTPVTQGSQDAPFNITADEIGGAFYTLPTVEGGARDLYHVDSAGNIIRQTFGGIDPAQITYSGNGTAMYFTATNASGNELWITFPTSDSASLAKDLNPGGGSSNPSQITRATEFVYFTADTGAGRRLLRVTNSTYETISEQNTGAPIFMDATSEIMPVQERQQGLGNWVYFTGTPQGGSQKLLYKINDGDFNQPAIRVITPTGHPVTNARHLAKFVAPGLGTYRLFFSCDGAGTEFDDAESTDKHLKPRGYELWCTEVGN